MNHQVNQAFLEEIGLESPWMNAAGFFGYMPPAHNEFNAPMGAFLPPPLTVEPRSPVENRALIRYPGGVLLHTALPNPGIKTAIRLYALRWSRLHLPVWLHLMPADVEEACEMSALADELENILAIEIELPLRFSVRDKLAMLNAAKGEKPVLAAIGVDEVDSDFILGCRSIGVNAVVLSAPRGRLLHKGQWVNGRLYGPALFPQMSLVLMRYRKIGLPLIAGCGVFTPEGGQELLDAGAAAVQVDAALWA